MLMIPSSDPDSLLTIAPFLELYHPALLSTLFAAALNVPGLASEKPPPRSRRADLNCMALVKNIF
jgi:hypothetical protein